MLGNDPELVKGTAEELVSESAPATMGDWLSEQISSAPNKLPAHVAKRVADIIYPKQQPKKPEGK